MKMLLALIFALAMPLTGHTKDFSQKDFVQVVYFAFGGTGLGVGPGQGLPISDEDLYAIPAKTCITNVEVVVTTSLTGTTQLDIGDDDDQNGFVVAATLTAGADSNGLGAYMYSSGMLHKCYTASGKEVKLDNTTANTAGAGFVVIRGFHYQ